MENRCPSPYRDGVGGDDDSARSEHCPIDIDQTVRPIDRDLQSANGLGAIGMGQPRPAPDQVRGEVLAEKRACRRRLDRLDEPA